VSLEQDICPSKVGGGKGRSGDCGGQEGGGGGTGRGGGGERRPKVSSG